jgi:hypothetical protein
MKRQRHSTIRAWTDLPFPEFGDLSPRSKRGPEYEAPLRQVEIVSWNRDKYCCIRVFDGDEVLHVNVKRWYLYHEKKRQYGENFIDALALNSLPYECGKDPCPGFKNRSFDHNYSKINS